MAVRSGNILTVNIPSNELENIINCRRTMHGVEEIVVAEQRLNCVDQDALPRCLARVLMGPEDKVNRGICIELNQVF
jgi:hypothetical protein